MPRMQERFSRFRHVFSAKSTEGWFDGGVAAFAALAIALYAFGMWPLALHVPMLETGDATFEQYVFKTVLDHRTYLRNPDLGAPFGATLYDFPIPEPTHQWMIRFIGLFTRDPFLAFNVFYLFSFATAAMAARWSLRRNGVGRLEAIAGAIAFAVLPYHFIRMGHTFLASYFAIPILGHYALQLATFKAPHLNDAVRLRVTTAVLLAIAAGSGVYYAFFGLLFLATGSAIGAMRSRHVVVLRTGVLYCAIVAGTIVITLLPNFLFHFTNGGNSLVAHRSYADAEIYGLKITQLLLPTPGHRLPLFDSFMSAYRTNAPLVNENATATLGMMGAAGFVIALLAFFSGDTRRYPLLSALGAFCVVAVLYAGIGGFGSLVSILVIPEIRGLNRISVFVGFYALMAFLLSLRQLRVTRSNFPVRCIVAMGIAGFACLDQVPVRAVVHRDIATFARERAFYDRLQSAIPSGSRVLQLPYDYFPESQRPRSGYRLMEPYLFTRGLRWSFGEMHGRPADVWNEHISTLSGKPFANAVAGAGFSAIYVDRRLYADNGASVEKELRQQFGPPVLEDGDFHRSLYRVARAAPESSPFIVVAPKPDWLVTVSAKDPHDEIYWTLGKGNGEMMVANPSPSSAWCSVSFKLRTFQRRHVGIAYGENTLAAYELVPGQSKDVTLKFLASPGVSQISLTTDVAAAAISPIDARKVGIGVEALAYGSYQQR
ncbi:MAG: hypothetical protein ABIR62_08880 [Dokdonella sp.]|uniref:hypothetical protein n=1 Tax=Dokdonella sp. TaxID=2291710 RepID=UPI0032673908